MAGFESAMVLLVACSLLAHGKYMNCGDGVVLCGTLTLETGLGNGMYDHPQPVVHGLWPETGHYGSSECKRPKDGASPSTLFPCYQQEGGQPNQLLKFEEHEWTKHGRCAGVASATAFFDQVCSLASGPLQTMQAAGTDINSMNDALVQGGYPVFNIDENHQQIELSACSNQDGVWVLAPVEQMPETCGGSKQIIV
eukprot:gnl/TRDRNA2_/TRDRNA2_207104_c0_seq1.p1 gnl/TRDRNA2_/TRDRNA2_207104_c0~~gnl/TRDRNA2_/TRDRNA2_207104_c0_seq1.p1  ORF type:complete len:214 (-),score=27.95 gnl/TRDRNA2_/TRDRNA2_207104_c0_seq1:63-650(-)